MSIEQLCVYCASSTGDNRAIREATVSLGRTMAGRGIGLVYGGGGVGLMGAIADAVMGAGGRATGVLPTALFPIEVAHSGLTELIEVDSMHERKAEMIRRSDGFVALPGGFGTLEELAEVLTWSQIGLHDKPIGLLNIDGYHDDLLRFFDRSVDDRLLKPANRDLVLVADDPADLLDRMAEYRPPVEPKWLDLPTGC